MVAAGISAGLLLQYAVIGLAVLLSAGYVVKRQLPGPIRKLRIACAVPLLREGRGPWVQALGRWAAPAATGTGAACATDCGGCGPTPPR